MKNMVDEVIFLNFPLSYEKLIINHYTDQQILISPLFPQSWYPFLSRFFGAESIFEVYFGPPHTSFWNIVTHFSDFRQKWHILFWTALKTALIGGRPNFGTGGIRALMLQLHKQNKTKLLVGNKIRDAGQFLLGVFVRGGRFPLAVNDRRTIYASGFGPAGPNPRGTKSAVTPATIFFKGLPVERGGLLLLE